jgi:catechol 2,3-dioxygenase-like lactoylglutathione lyase family enzyme
MFSHVMVGANDVAASKKFYDAILGALGVKPATLDPKGRAVYATKSGVFMITKPLDGKPAHGANGGTIGFAAGSAKEIDAWHAAGVANNGTACEDPPGVRGEYYLAYLRDPSGNKLCALMQV